MTDLSEEEVQPGALGDTLIRSFGLYWTRDAVDWESKKLLGDRRHYKLTVKNPTAKKRHCDVWKQHGIYALYSNFKLVYVGLANSIDEGIGSRLYSHHTKPRMQGRWDAFSWFGIDAYDNEGRPVLYKTAPVSGPTIVRTLELVSILVADPPLNRSQGRFKGAEQIVQDTSKAPPKPEHLMEDLLEEIKNLRGELKKRK